MKLQNITSSLLAISSFSTIVTASSFGNSAPLLISSNLLEFVNNENNNNNIKAIDSIDNADKILNDMTNSICSDYKDSSITLIKIHGLDESDITSSLIDQYSLNKLINNVVYNSIDQFNDNEFGNSCESVNKIDTKSLIENSDNSNNDNKWSQILNNSNNKYNIIDLYKENSLDTEYLNDINQILIHLDTDYMIIQGLPTFKTSFDSLVEQTSLKINNLLNNNNNNNSNKNKRNDINYDAVEKELQETFEEINELLDDSVFTINEDESNSKLNTQSNSKKDHVINGSLFDKYSFFSNGIWMGTIVLLFLTWLLTVALSWLNDMKISYGAFDKPFDFEKKLQ